MNDSVEILVPDSWQDFQSDTVKFQLPWRNIVNPAIDSDVMTPPHQARRKMFGERFKAAIAGRNASSSENGYAHRTNNASSLAVEPFPRKKTKVLMDHAAGLRG